MQPFISAALEKAFGFALAKSPKAPRPIDAFWRAATIVGNIEGAPDCVKNLPQTALHNPAYCRLQTSQGFLIWLAEDDNLAKVEAVALALIEGRLSPQSSAASISEIIRSADTRLGLPVFEIPDEYPALQKLGLDSPRLVSAIVDAYALAWQIELVENARVVSGDYEEYDAPPERFYDAHDAGEAIRVVRAMLRGRLISYCHWHEFASSARALFRLADMLIDGSLSYDFAGDDMVISDDAWSTIGNIVCDDRGSGTLADDPITRQVRRYIAAVNEREARDYRAMIPNLAGGV